MPSQDFFVTITADGTGTLLESVGAIGGSTNANGAGMFVLASTFVPPTTTTAPPTTTTSAGGLAADFCATGNLSVLPIETYLLTNTLGKPNLALLQSFVMHNMSATNSTIALRAATELIYKTELRGVFEPLMKVPASSLAVTLCTRARIPAVDAAATRYYAIADASLTELQSLTVPDGYLNILRAFLHSDSFEARVAGLCATVFIVALISM